MPLSLGGCTPPDGAHAFDSAAVGQEGDPPEGAECAPQAIDSVVHGPKYLVFRCMECGSAGAAGGGAAAQASGGPAKGSPGRGTRG